MVIDRLGDPFMPPPASSIVVGEGGQLLLRPLLRAILRCLGVLQPQRSTSADDSSGGCRTKFLPRKERHGPRRSMTSSATVTCATFARHAVLISTESSCPHIESHAILGVQSTVSAIERRCVLGPMSASLGSAGTFRAASKKSATLTLCRRRAWRGAVTLHWRSSSRYTTADALRRACLSHSL